MAEIIVRDIFDTVSYLKYGFFISFLLTILLVILQYLHTKSLRVDYVLKYMIFVFYVTALIQITLLSRESGSRIAMDLIPFSTWGTSARSRAYEYENMLLFLPMGILLPVCFKCFGKLRYACPAFILISCLIELTQHITQRGYMQTDDVIMNGIGGVCGYFIWKVYRKTADIKFRGDIGKTSF